MQERTSIIGVNRPLILSSHKYIERRTIAGTEFEIVMKIWHLKQWRQETCQDILSPILPIDNIKQSKIESLLLNLMKGEKWIKRASLN